MNRRESLVWGAIMGAGLAAGTLLVYNYETGNLPVRESGAEQPAYTISQPTAPKARINYEIPETPYLPIPMTTQRNTNGLEKSAGGQE